MNGLRAAALRANHRIGAEKLAPLTWGNASAYDATLRIMAIKPSGIPYNQLSLDDIVVVRVDDMQVVAGDRNPSSDALTHARLYRAWPSIGAIVHTHSPKATAWAQLARDLPCLGTTHADHFAGPVPCTRTLSAEEVHRDYVGATADVIVSAFEERGIHPDAIPATLVAYHAPFTWGHTVEEAVDNAVALESCADMALSMLAATGSLTEIPAFLREFHYARKHGPNATYGQR